MQTFLPYPSFEESLKCLDYRRLGKQRVEAMQLINCITQINLGNDPKGWVNHPARIMWHNHLDALKLYCNLAIAEWINRFYNNSMIQYKLPSNIKLPPWIGDKNFHASHRSNLLRKYPIWYSQFGWTEPDNLPYVWPISN